MKSKGRQLTVIVKYISNVRSTYCIKYLSLEGIDPDEDGSGSVWVAAREGWDDDQYLGLQIIKERAKGKLGSPYWEVIT